MQQLLRRNFGRSHPQILERATACINGPCHHKRGNGILVGHATTVRKKQNYIGIYLSMSMPWNVSTRTVEQVKRLKTRKGLCMGARREKGVCGPVFVLRDSLYCITCRLTYRDLSCPPLCGKEGQREEPVDILAHRALIGYYTTNQTTNKRATVVSAEQRMMACILM